jgi:hypothetical protein
MSNPIRVGDRVRVRTDGGIAAARKYANEEGHVSLGYEGLDGAPTCDVRLFGHNFDTVLEERDLLAPQGGEKPVSNVGLLSGLESQSELTQLLDEIYGESNYLLDVLYKSHNLTLLDEVEEGTSSALYNEVASLYG